jgi:predicted DNA-binding protein
MIEPDSPTKERLKYLSSVGKALNDTYSEQNLETGDGFYLALDNLNKFKEGLDKLILDEQVKKGMNDLVEYLRKKIERRTGYVGS